MFLGTFTVISLASSSWARSITQSEFTKSELGTKVNTDLGIRQDDRMNYRFVAGIITMSGYVYYKGADDVEKVIDSCTAYKTGESKTAGACVKEALKTSAGFTLGGLAAAYGNERVVGLIFGQQALLNELGGNNNGAARFVGMSPANMSETAGKAKAGVKNIFAPQQTCPNHNKAVQGEPWTFHFNGYNGVKIQCKPSCGSMDDIDHAASDLWKVWDDFAYYIMATGYLNSQFTLYNTKTHEVYARCKVTLETGPTDTCPEDIEGSSCTF